MNLKNEIKEILKNDFENILNIKNYIYKNKKEILNLTLKKEIKENDFYKITSLLTPQSRSSLWEKYFILKNDAKKINSKENKGDLFFNNIYYEYKISGFNVGNILHVVQVRLWQNCCYIIEYVNFKKKYIFILNNNQMKKECILLGSSAHGTSEANKFNINKEVRFSIKYNSEEFKRWIKNYSK